MAVPQAQRIEQEVRTMQAAYLQTRDAFMRNVMHHHDDAHEALAQYFAANEGQIITLISHGNFAGVQTLLGRFHTSQGNVNHLRNQLSTDLVNTWDARNELVHQLNAAGASSDMQREAASEALVNITYTRGRPTRFTPNVDNARDAEISSAVLAASLAETHASHTATPVTPTAADVGDQATTGNAAQRAAQHRQHP